MERRREEERKRKRRREEGGRKPEEVGGGRGEREGREREDLVTSAPAPSAVSLTPQAAPSESVRPCWGAGCP